MHPQPFDTAFYLDSPLGRCVAVHLPRDSRAEVGLDLLHPLERNFAEQLAPLRRTSWVGGRIALRRAMAAVGSFDAPILSTPRGAPELPAGVAGSISHKRSMAIAIAAPAGGFTLGVDLEESSPRPVDIARRVLVDEELEALNRFPEPERWRGLMLRFSLKEAVYKALDPFVERYIAFSEASVDPRDDGSAAIVMNLRGGEGPFALSASWFLRDAYIISVVRACRSAPRDL